MMTVLEKPDYRKVEREASKILRAFDVRTPPVDIVKIARESGVNVVFAHFNASHSNISGFYDFEESTIFVNSDEYPLRQTFTIAHEFGHRVLHEDWAKSAEYKVLLRDSSMQSNDVREKEASSFAANLLVHRFLMDKYWHNMRVEDRKSTRMNSRH